MSCHIFHMSCGEMGKVLYAWGLTYTQKYRSRFCRIWKPPSHTQGCVGCDTRTTVHGWVDIYSTCLVIHGKDLTASMGCNPYIWMPSIQTKHRPPKMWAHVWKDLQNHQAIHMEVLVMVQGTSDRGLVVVHSTCLADAWEMSHKSGM